jgi:hypothetical protein
MFGNMLFPNTFTQQFERSFMKSSMFFSFLKISTLDGYWEIISSVVWRNTTIICLQVNPSYTLLVEEITFRVPSTT